MKVRYVECCDNCRSNNWSIYGAAVEARSIHCIQCLCHDCGLVFANPRATEEELKDFYAGYWTPERFEEQWQEKKFDYWRNHLREIAAYVKGGRLLEIGAGTGAFLKVAKDAGYEVYGIELSEEAVKYAKSRFEIDRISRGTLEQSDFCSQYFDVAYAWHVVEHVPDLDLFLTEVRRVLKPGGMLYLGTESYFRLDTAFSRFACFKRGRIPGIVTASQHTFVFHPRSLRDCLKRRGFDVAKLAAYDEVTTAQRLNWAYSESWRKRQTMKGVVRLAPLVNKLLRTGPYLKAIAIKRENCVDHP